MEVFIITAATLIDYCFIIVHVFSFSASDLSIDSGHFIFSVSSDCSLKVWLAETGNSYVNITHTVQIWLHRSLYLSPYKHIVFTSRFVIALLPSFYQLLYVISMNIKDGNSTSNRTKW